jgi:hypothetical protein
MRKLTRLLKQITGHMLRPKEQQQQTQPKHNLNTKNCVSTNQHCGARNTLAVTSTHHLTFIGRFFFRIEFNRDIVALYSSGAIFDMSWVGNSELNLFERPNLGS